MLFGLLVTAKKFTINKVGILSIRGSQEVQIPSIAPANSKNAYYGLFLAIHTIQVLLCFAPAGQTAITKNFNDYLKAALKPLPVKRHRPNNGHQSNPHLLALLNVFYAEKR